MASCTKHTPDPLSTVMKVIKEDEEPHVHQCWECDSEGEFYVHEPETFQPDNGTDYVTDDDVKLH